MELIKIEENNGEKAVSARELHDFLESKQDFSTWIKNRIEKFDLLENIDYQAFHNFVECQNGIGGTTKIEYILSLDAAKELSMVEGNERGKQARRYFIECEKRLRNSFYIPQTKSEALRLAAMEAEKVEALQKQIEADAPKVQLATAFEASKGSCLIGELAKILAQNGYMIGRNRLFDWLRDNDYLCKSGEAKNQPEQRYVEMKLFEMKKTVFTHGNETRSQATTLVTPKGQQYFINKFLTSNTLPA